jgi:hypothetical protein
MLKKIAFGAYSLTMKQGHGKFFSYLSSVLIASSAPLLWFIELFVLCTVIFKIKYFFPFWVLIVFFFLIILLMPIKKTEMDALWETKDNSFREESIKVFWLCIFGPVIFILIIFIILKLIHRI